MSKERPAPADGIEVHEVQDGFVIYDAAADRVHYLDPVASLVFSFCDGTRSDAELTALVQSAWELDAPPAEQVSECVARLRGEGVLQ
jgi:hypothetical protein